MDNNNILEKDMKFKNEMDKSKILFATAGYPLWKLLCTAPVIFVTTVAMAFVIVIGVTYFTSIAALVLAVVSVYIAIINMANGVGAVLLSFAIGTMSLSFVAPCFYLANFFVKQFKGVSKLLNKKFSAIDNMEVQNEKN